MKWSYIRLSLIILLWFGKALAVTTICKPKLKTHFRFSTKKVISKPQPKVPTFSFFPRFSTCRLPARLSMKVHRANEGPGTLEARWVRTAYFWSFFGGQCHVLIPKKAARSCIIAKQKCRPCPEPRRAIPNIPHDGNSLCTFPGPPAPIQLNPKMSCHSMICSRCCTSAFFRSKIWEGQLAPKITQTEVRSSNPNIPHLRLKIVHRSSLAGWTPVWPSLLTLLTRSLAGSLPHLCSLQSRDKCLSLTLTAHSRRTVASALLQGTQVVRECTHCIVI